MVFFWKEWLVWSCIICEVFPQRVCKANLVNSGYFLFQSFCGFSSVLRTAPISMRLRKDWVGGRVAGPWETHLHTSCDKGDHILVKTMCGLINRPCLQCLLGLCQSAREWLPLIQVLFILPGSPRTGQTVTGPAATARALVNQVWPPDLYIPVKKAKLILKSRKRRFTHRSSLGRRDRKTQWLPFLKSIFGVPTGG